MSRFGVLCMAFLALTLVAGCGGGTSSSGTVDLSSEASLDGYTHATGLSTNADLAYVGDSSTNAHYEAFVSFDTTVIPASATVESATLRIYQAGGDGGGYALGSVVLEHVYYGTETDSAYSTPSLSYITGSFSTAFLIGYHEVDVTAAVQDDVTNGRAHSQFRFFHQTATDSDGQSDDDAWYMGDSATNKPRLVVTYH